MSFSQLEIGQSPRLVCANQFVRARNSRTAFGGGGRKLSAFRYLLFPCEKATIVPELASSWRSAAAIVNSGTRRSSAAARSKFSSFSRSSLSSPGSSKTRWSMRQNGMRGWSRSVVLNCISYIMLFPAGVHIQYIQLFSTTFSKFYSVTPFGCTEAKT